MYNYVANCGRKALLKQIFSVFLIFTLYFNFFNSAWALTTVRDWSITNVTRQGASTNLAATKSIIIDGNVINKTSTAKITPTPSQVSNMLKGGVAAVALSLAVDQLLGAVDWVLDSANNQITYKPKQDLSKPPAYCQNNFETSLSNPSIVAYGCTIPEVAQNLCKKRLTYSNVDGCTVSNFTSTTFRIVTSCKVWDGTCYGMDSTITPRVTVNPYYNPTATNEPKTIPLDTVSQKVITNAEAGNADAQVATGAAADDALANDVAIQNDVAEQLATNSKSGTNEQVTGDTTPKDTTNPNAGDTIKLNFPVFCTWAPLVCEAAQSAIKFPTTLTNWWNTATTSISDAWTWTKARYEASVTSISDFFKNEPDETDNTDLPAQEIPIPQLETNAFTATPGCPEPIPIHVKIGVEGIAYISYEPICQFASKWSFVVPLICFLSGAMIIVGVGRKGEDSEI